MSSGRWIAMQNPKDPAGSSMDTIVFVTFAGVGPVDDVNGTVGAVVEVDAAEPGVGRLGDVVLVAGNVAAAFALEPIDVNAAAVEVEGEELTTVFSGPVVAQVDARAAVGVAAAERVISSMVADVAAVSFGIRGFSLTSVSTAFVRSATIVGRWCPDRTTLSGVPMKVVGVRVDGVVNAAVGRDGGAAGVMCTRNQVKEVAGDGVGDKCFTVLVPIEAPGIGEAVAEDFEDLARGMIAPDAAVDRNALLLRAARRADPAGAGSTAAAVEPTVWPPAEAIGAVVVVLGGGFEAVEDDVGRTVG